MPMFVGLLLEIPALRNYSLALFSSQIFMLAAHILFLVNYSGLVLPLSLLAVGNAIFSAGIWASVSISILQADISLYLDLELVSQSVNTQDNAWNGSAQEERLGVGQGNQDLETLLPVDPDSTRREEEHPGNGAVMIGYGIITSLMGASIVVTPLFLVAAESWAGFWGLEVVFAVLASLGALISFGLVSFEKRLR